MKMIKRNMILGCLAMFLFSCSESFLDLAPISNSNANNFYKTTADFDLAVNAAYATLYKFFGPVGGPSYCAEQMSDNCTMYNIAGIQADKWAFKDYSLNPSNTEVYRLWQEDYNCLYNINIVLDKIETASVSDTYKEQVKAQMMFLRGLYYFYMAQMWGDLPLVTAPVTATDSYKILRSPVADVYKLVVSDLTYAASKLPAASAVTVGNASKGAALSLLGKVYLVLGDKTSAASVLQQVYDSKQYQLLPSYASLWVVANKNTKESIFEIQYKGGVGNPYSAYFDNFCPTENFTITNYGGGMNMVTDDLFKEYETGDPRRDASIDTGYTKKSGVFVAIKFPAKWLDLASNTGSGVEYANNNFMVIRYADVLLMLSEATGDATYLNQVRARVGLAGFGTAGYPSALYPTLDKAVEHERRSELALEFHRWFDLKRTNRAVTVLTAKGKAVTADKLLLPIPEIVRTQNPAITQNAAYK